MFNSNCLKFNIWHNFTISIEAQHGENESRHIISKHNYKVSGDRSLGKLIPHSLGKLIPVGCGKD